MLRKSGPRGLWSLERLLSCCPALHPKPFTGVSRTRGDSSQARQEAGCAGGAVRRAHCRRRSAPENGETTCPRVPARVAVLRSEGAVQVALTVRLLLHLRCVCVRGVLERLFGLVLVHCSIWVGSDILFIMTINSVVREYNNGKYYGYSLAYY